MLAIAGLNAQNPAANQEQSSSPQYGRGVFIDADNDGICDNFPARAGVNRGGRGFAAAQGQGFGRGRNLPAGQGRGIAAGNGRGMGPGKGQGLQPGGRFYVDEDKNGVCDVYEKQVKK